MHHAFGHIRSPLLSIALAAMLSFLALACAAPSSDPADSQSDTSDTAISARQAPLFKLPNANAPAGMEVSLSQFKDSGPVVLVFYRAHW